jgi:hypothetical protein
LARLWTENNNRLLINHPVQYQILEEALIQCEALASFAHKQGKKESALKYEQNLSILKEVYATKKKTGYDVGERDRVFQAIKRNCQSLR